MGTRIASYQGTVEPLMAAHTDFGIHQHQTIGRARHGYTNKIRENGGSCASRNAAKDVKLSSTTFLHDGICRWFSTRSATILTNFS